MAAFMRELREADNTAANALAFTILTAARSNEVLGARWSEIAPEAGVDDTRQPLGLAPACRAAH